MLNDEASRAALEITKRGHSLHVFYFSGAEFLR
jgi:hypothetical protein